MNQHLIGLDEKTLAALEKLGIQGQAVLERMFLAFRAEPLAHLVASLVAAFCCLYGAIRLGRTWAKNYKPDELMEGPDLMIFILAIIFTVGVSVACIISLISLSRYMAADAYAIRQTLKALGVRPVTP